MIWSNKQWQQAQQCDGEKKNAWRKRRKPQKGDDEKVVIINFF